MSKSASARSKPNELAMRLAKQAFMERYGITDEDLQNGMLYAKEIDDAGVSCILPMAHDNIEKT